MLRAVILTLLIIVLIAVTVPLDNSMAHWLTPPVVNARRHRRHSRAWWRRHRAMRRNRYAAQRRRELAIPTAAASHAKVLPDIAPAVSTQFPASVTNKISPVSTALTAPRAASVLPLPSTWSTLSSRPGEMKFSVRSDDGRSVGTAVLSRIAMANASSTLATAHNKMVGGLSVAELRHVAIARMIAEGGWVVNDMMRELGGRPVFIVIAQTGAANNARRTWNFYFTETDGYVYSLTTTAPEEFADALAAQSEQVVSALGSHGTTTLAQLPH